MPNQNNFVGLDELQAQEENRSGSASKAGQHYIGLEDLPPEGAAQESRATKSQGKFLSNTPEDITSNFSGPAKNLATAGIKGVAGVPGMVGDVRQLRNYLGARLHSAITGAKPEETLQILDKWQKEHPILSKVIDPTSIFPTTEEVAAPILEQTGEYHPTTQAGRLGAAAVQAATTGALTAGAGGLGSAARAAPGAFVAGGTGELATELTGDPLAGLATGFAAPAAVKVITKPAVNYAKPAAAGFSDKIAQEQAAEKFSGLTRDPEKALAELKFQQRELVPGAPATPAQITQDPGIAAAQLARETASPEFHARTRDVAGQRNVAMREAEAGLGRFDADVMAPGESIRQRVAAAEAQGDAQIAALKQQADALHANLPPGVHPEDIGEALRNAIAKANAKSQAKVREAYSAVPKDLPVDMTGVKSAAENILSNANKYDKPFSSDLIGENGVLSLAKNAPEIETFDNLRALDSRITAEMRAAKLDPNRANEHRLLTELKKSVMKAIDSITGSNELNAAKALHKERQATYAQGPVPNVLKTYGGAQDFKVLDSAIPEKVFRGDNTGYQTAQAFLKAADNSPVAVAAMRDMANESLRRAISNTPDGLLTQKVLDAWKAKFQQPLRALEEVDPGYSSRFDNTAAATEALNAARTNVANARSNALIGPAKDIFNASSEDAVVSIVGNMLKNKNGAQQISDTIQSAGNNQAAIDGLRRAGAKWLVDATSNAGVQGGVPIMSGAKLRQLLNNNSNAFEALFGKEGMDSLRLMAADSERAQAAIDLSKVAGSNTANKIIASLKENAGKYTDKGISGLMFLTALDGLRSGSLTYALVSSGAAGMKSLADVLRQRGLNRVNDIIEDALINPELARELLQRAKSNKSADVVDRINNITRQIARSSSVAGQQTEQGKELPSLTIHRATGGQVGMSHEQLVNRLMRLAERAKKAENSQTEAILNVPDEAVAKALDVAKQAI